VRVCAAAATPSPVRGARQAVAQVNRGTDARGLSLLWLSVHPGAIATRSSARRLGKGRPAAAELTRNHWDSSAGSSMPMSLKLARHSAASSAENPAVPATSSSCLAARPWAHSLRSDEDTSIGYY